MIRIVFRGALLFLAPLSALMLGRPAVAQTTPGTPKKPMVKGTAQLPGDVGTVGTTYTLGTDDNAYNLTIHRFYYVASRLTLNGLVAYPEGDKKFLVFDYTIQNPNSSSEFRVYSQTFAMTAVDANNQNYELQGDAENTTTHQPLEISLKPGQRVEGRMYFIVPAATQIPKIILNYGGPKVMRFDMHGVIASVEPLLADPADKTGSATLTALPAKFGVTYPCGQFDITVDGVSYSTAAFNGNAPDDGKHYLVCTMRVKNMMSAQQGDVDINNGNGFDVYTMDADGNKTEFSHDYIKASSADALSDTAVTTGVERRFRVLIPLGTSDKPTTLTVVFGDGYRKLVYTLNSIE